MLNLNARRYKIIMSQIGWKGKPTRLFYLYLMGIAVPAIVAEGMSMAVRGAFDDDDEYDGMFGEGNDAHDMQIAFDLLVMSQVKFISAFFPGGGAITTRLYGTVTPQLYDDKISLSPVLSFADSAIKGTAVALEAIFSDEELDTKQKATALKSALNALAVGFRIPLNWFAKPVSYLVKVEGGESNPEGVWDYVKGFLTGRDGTEE